MQRTKTLLIIGIALLALLAGIGVSYYVKQRPQTISAKVNASIFPQARNLQAFTLTDGKGLAFTNQNLQGHWNLVFFGFTNCPVVCPTTLAILNQAYTKLKNDGVKPLPRVVFISVDPQRDNLNRVSQYAAGFNPDFIGITGEKAQIDQLARDMNVMYMRVDLKPAQPGDKPTYTIDHSTSIMLVDANGQLRAIFSSPETGDKFAQDYQEVVNHLK